MTAIAPASRAAPGHYGFRRAARPERDKLRTLRPVKWALPVTLAGTGLSITCGYAVVLLAAGGWLPGRRGA